MESPCAHAAITAIFLSPHPTPSKSARAFEPPPQ
jgi:hypothetical protein